VGRRCPRRARLTGVAATGATGLPSSATGPPRRSPPQCNLGEHPGARQARQLAGPAAPGSLVPGRPEAPSSGRAIVAMPSRVPRWAPPNSRVAAPRLGPRHRGGSGEQAQKGATMADLPPVADPTGGADRRARCPPLPWLVASRALPPACTYERAVPALCVDGESRHATGQPPHPRRRTRTSRAHAPPCGKNVPARWGAPPSGERLRSEVRSSPTPPRRHGAGATGGHLGRRAAPRDTGA
jgi:hypothetical protein